MFGNEYRVSTNYAPEKPVDDQGIGVTNELSKLVYHTFVK